jgi:hypothetical protein
MRFCVIFQSLQANIGITPLCPYPSYSLQFTIHLPFDAIYLTPKFHSHLNVICVFIYLSMYMHIYICNLSPALYCSQTENGQSCNSVHSVFLTITASQILFEELTETDLGFPCSLRFRGSVVTVKTFPSR